MKVRGILSRNRPSLTPKAIELAGAAIANTDKPFARFTYSEMLSAKINNLALRIPTRTTDVIDFDWSRNMDDHLLNEFRYSRVMHRWLHYVLSLPDRLCDDVIASSFSSSFFQR